MARRQSSLKPWEQLPPSASANDIRYATECAGRVGGRGFSVPPDFERCGDADGALAALPAFTPPVNAVWIANEEQAVKSLALEAARRTGVPYLAVDIGQLESGEWIVVEIGDGQFAGLSQVNGLKLWNVLREALDDHR